MAPVISLSQVSIIDKDLVLDKALDPIGNPLGNGHLIDATDKLTNGGFTGSKEEALGGLAGNIGLSGETGSAVGATDTEVRVVDVCQVGQIHIPIVACLEVF